MTMRIDDTLGVLAVLTISFHTLQAEAPLDEPQEARGKWHATASIGAGFQGEQKVSSGPNGYTLYQSTDPGIHLETEISAEVIPSLEVGFSIGWISNPIDSFREEYSIGGVTYSDTSSADNQTDMQFPFLVTTTYRPNLSRKVSPYVGLGAGGLLYYYQYREEDIFWDTIYYSTEFAFGLQGRAGIDFKVGENMGLGIAYRLTGAFTSEIMEDTVITHSILLSLRF
jgi:opacity protein-like surface antigen